MSLEAEQRLHKKTRSILKRATRARKIAERKYEKIQLELAMEKGKVAALESVVKVFSEKWVFFCFDYVSV